jgi:hypothetical protein
MTRRTGIVWRSALLSCALLSLPERQVGAQTLEYEVKAAYLLNFLGYAEWPPEVFTGPDDPLRVCIAGRDPFGKAIDRVFQSGHVNGRPIVIERLAAHHDTLRCALLFIPASANADLWLDSAGSATLTIGESSNFLERGGVIRLVVDAGRVRFDVNVAEAASRRIRLSSHLLRLARSTQVPAR